MHIRAAIIDDRQLIIDAVTALLGDTPDISVVASTTVASDLFQLLAQAPIDVLILDLHMPGTSWQDILGRIRQDKPDLPVVALTSAPAAILRSRVLAAGARGYVEKGYAAEDLPLALRVVSNGDRYTPSHAFVVSQVDEGRLLDVNHRFTKVFGHSRNDVLGRRAEDLGLWDDLAVRRKLITAAVRHGRVQSYAAFRTNRAVVWQSEVTIRTLRQSAYPQPVVLGEVDGSPAPSSD
ncbi:response regulator [Nitrospira sp. Nam74]